MCSRPAAASAACLRRCWSRIRKNINKNKNRRVTRQNEMKPETGRRCVHDDDKRHAARFFDLASNIVRRSVKRFEVWCFYRKFCFKRTVRYITVLWWDL